MYIYLELFTKQIQRLPWQILNFDWTFKFGSNLYDNYDQGTISKIMKQSAAISDDVKQENDFEENDFEENDFEDENETKVIDEDELEPNPERRDKAGHIYITWLVACTEHEFILTVSPLIYIDIY